MNITLLRCGANEDRRCADVSFAAVLGAMALCAASLFCNPAAAVEPGAGAEVSFEHIKLPKTQFTFVYLIT